MWELTNIQRRPAELDFSSAGGGRWKVGQLFVGPTRIANAVELTDWQDENTQLIVCESCGTIHCEPGGWVSIRQGGDFIVLGPDSRLFKVDELDRIEYRPPEYVRKLGWPYMSLATYTALRKSVPELRAVERLRPLGQREVAAIVQWEAPARALGRPFERITMRKDMLVACSVGNVMAEADRLELLLEKWVASDGIARLEPYHPDDVQVEFYVDIAGTPTWRPLVLRDGVPMLCLEPGLVAAAKSSEYA